MQLTPANATVGVPYSGTFTINNATSAAATSIPAGLTVTFAASGLNLVATVTGTPTGSGSANAFTISATNASGNTCLASTVSLSAGVLTVANGAAPPPPPNACPAPTI